MSTSNAVSDAQRARRAGVKLSAIFGALLAGTAPTSAAAAGPPIAGYCYYIQENSILYTSSIFHADMPDKEDWEREWRNHLIRSDVKFFGGSFCRAWKDVSAAEVAAEERAKVPSHILRVVQIDWVPDGTTGGSRRDIDRPVSASREAAPIAKPAAKSAAVKPAVASTKYVEVPGGPSGTMRLSPEVAARNQAAAEEYRRKLEAHVRAMADQVAEHDRKLAAHQENAAKAAAANQAHERELAANAAEVAAHQVAMDDYRKKLAGKASTDDDPNRCITSPAIKPGLRGNTEVHVTNGCDQKVDIVICLKRTSGDWLCGARFGILAQRSMSFMSTNATGEIYVDAVTFGSKNKLGRPAGIIK